MEKDHNVNFFLSKTQQGIMIRGKKECIESAEEELKKLVYGGDDFSVQKMFVPGSILGAIIGKGGKNILKYESDHSSVMVNVHSLSNTLSIRGPPEEVENCKGVIIKDILDCNVTESIQIDSTAYDSLSKEGVVPKLLTGLPVNFHLSENAVRLRGCYKDVESVKMNVNDIVSGVYKSCIMLTTDNLNTISRQIKVNPNQFKQISDDTSITIDNCLGSIILEGKRSSVRRAKAMLLEMLETISPSTFKKIKFLKPLLRKMGSSQSISLLGKTTKCLILLERDICTFIVQASTGENLRCGVKAITDKIQGIMKLSYVAMAESWLIQHIISNSGEDIKKIKEGTECEITLLMADGMISIVGKEEADVAEAKTAVEGIMDQAKKEICFIDLPESSMQIFVGVSGKHMKAMASSHGVDIDRVKRTKSRIRIQGKENAVKRAICAVNTWLSKWEKKNAGLTITLDESRILLLEKDSSILDEIQNDFGVKVDLNRKNFTATVRGGKDNSQSEAGAKLKKILSETMYEEICVSSTVKDDATNLPQAFIENETIDIPSHQQNDITQLFERAIEEPVSEIEAVATVKVGVFLLK